MWYNMKKLLLDSLADNRNDKHRNSACNKSCCALHKAEVDRHHSSLLFRKLENCRNKELDDKHIECQELEESCHNCCYSVADNAVRLLEELWKKAPDKNENDVAHCDCRNEREKCRTDAEHLCEEWRKRSNCNAGRQAAHDCRHDEHKIYTGACDDLIVKSRSCALKHNEKCNKNSCLSDPSDL